MTTLSNRALKQGFAPRLNWVAVWLLLVVGSLALTRILYEGLFPRWWWLARPLPAISLSLGTAVLLTWVLNRTAGRGLFLLPLGLNLLWLFDPTVDLVGSRLIFAASLWLAALLLAREKAAPQAWRWLGVLFVLAALLPIYLLTMPNAVGQADTFEFQVVAPQLGIAHPTGYPLFLLLGKLFTLIPLNTVAWRLNFAVMVYGLTAVSLLFGLGYRLGARGEVAVLTAVTLGLTPTFWSQAIEAEVYTLHALIVVAALFVMREIGGWRLGEIEDRRSKIDSWLPLLLVFIIGLGLTNHLTTIFLLPATVLTLLFQRRTTTTLRNPQSAIRNPSRAAAPRFTARPWAWAALWIGWSAAVFRGRCNGAPGWTTPRATKSSAASSPPTGAGRT